MQASTLLQTDNHTSTPPLSFLQAGCPSCRPTNSVKALKEIIVDNNNNNNIVIDVMQSVCLSVHVSTEHNCKPYKKGRTNQYFSNLITCFWHLTDSWHLSEQQPSPSGV